MFVHDNQGQCLLILCVLCTVTLILSVLSSLPIARPAPRVRLVVFPAHERLMMTDRLDFL